MRKRRREFRLGSTGQKHVHCRPPASKPLGLGSQDLTRDSRGPVRDDNGRVQSSITDRSVCSDVIVPTLSWNL